MDKATLALVDAALDATYLSSLCGEPVVATSLRVKPGVAVVAGWVSQLDAGRRGWARFLLPPQHDKAGKVQAKASALGLEVTTVSLSAEVLFQWGEFAADPKMFKLLAASDVPLRQGRVLRYNPLRRVVAGVDDQVVRITAAAVPWRSRLLEVIAGRVPVPDVLLASEHVLVTDLVGTGDVAGLVGLPESDELSIAGEVGGLFAALHAGVADVDSKLVAVLGSVAVDAQAQAQAHAGLLGVLLPDEERRVLNLAGCLGELEGDAVLVHGDASADQVLVDKKSGRLWLTDFDRVHVAPAVLDCGSYFAESDLSAEAEQAFLEGYGRSGLQVPSAEQIGKAKAHSLMNRLMDPLRKASPTWRDEVRARIDALEEIMA